MNFCKAEGCGRALLSPEELSTKQCRYCNHKVEPSAAGFTATYQVTNSPAFRPAQPLPTVEVYRGFATIDFSFRKTRKLGHATISDITIFPRAIVKSVYQTSHLTHPTRDMRVSDVSECSECFGFIVDQMSETIVHELVHTDGNIWHRHYPHRGYGNQFDFNAVTNAMGHLSRCILEEKWGESKKQAKAKRVQVVDLPDELNEPESLNIQTPNSEAIIRVA